MEEIVGKNVVLCLDGTGNEYSDKSSNVVKLFSCLPRVPKTQVAYYHPGLGTAGEMSAPSVFGRLYRKWLILKGQAIGAGIVDHIGAAYSFLMEHYEPGDRVYIFGFSRGAYTARALAAMLNEFGLMDPGCEDLVSYAMKLFTNRSGKNLEMAEGFKRAFGTPCPVHFIGVWDTVSSVGMFWNPLSLPFTKVNPNVTHGRHAISIDERRKFFRQNEWQSLPGQDLIEVWFPGVHSDVGGGYPESESALSKNSLKWMIEEAHLKGLLINEEWAADVLGGEKPYVQPSFSGKIHDEAAKLLWKIVALVPKRSWDLRGGQPRRYWNLSGNSSRVMPEGALLHESVNERMADTSCSYGPCNIPHSAKVYRRS